MKSKFLRLSNFNSRPLVSLAVQNVQDKERMIEANKKVIMDMRKRLETETNEKICARCREIIQSCKESNQRLKKDIEILSKKWQSDLCSLNSRQREN